MNIDFRRYIQIFLVVIWGAVLFSKTNVSYYYRGSQFASDYCTMYSTIIQMIISIIGIVISKKKILFIIFFFVSFIPTLLGFLVILLGGPLV